MRPFASLKVTMKRPCAANILDVSSEGGENAGGLQHHSTDKDPTGTATDMPESGGGLSIRNL